MRRRISKSVKPSSALRRLGLAAPPPFVGRQAELGQLSQALQRHGLVIVYGAVGSGKTRLARELCDRQGLIGTLQAAHVRCYPGDRGAALLARAERALDVLPGALADVLCQSERLLVIDDIHHLPEHDIASFLAVAAPSEAVGRLLVISRDRLPLRRDSDRSELTLEGLDEAAARELWTHLEETYGPTPAGAVDAALVRTRGMPLALRREYARAAFGKHAWTVAKLTANSRKALEALSVLRVPAAPAAVAAVAAGCEAEDALDELVSRQLIDPLADARFMVHDVVRDETLDAIDGEQRIALERAAAELIAGNGRGTPGHGRPAWDAGDDGAIGLLDPVDRLREQILHLLAAGDAGGAVRRLEGCRELIARRGAGGEILALIELVAAAGPDDTRPLRRLRAEIAARQGRIIEALEVQGAETLLDPVEAALLVYASGDVEPARAGLVALTQADQPEQRCRAAAALAEIELARGDLRAAEGHAAGAFERDRGEVGESVRARLHLALAAIEDHRGSVTAARAALSRAAGAGTVDPATVALIEARRAFCLAREGRLGEARAALEEAERVARELDAAAVADEIRRCRALVDARRGELVAAGTALERLISARRHRGDEIGALEAELDLAWLLLRRGELAAAAELGAACRASAERRQLAGFSARADLIAAAVDLAELRLDSAANLLRRIGADRAAPADLRLEAAALLAQTEAALGQPPALRPELEQRDEVDVLRTRAFLLLAAGDSGAALETARILAVRAERAGRTAEVAEGLALAARLQLARGDRAGATAAATRAAREALGCGLSHARAGALLVLAALAREEGDVATASAYARDAAELAAEAGLPIERLVATAAMDAIAEAGGAAGGGALDARNGAAATMTQAALDAAARVLADLGLTAVRPFRVVAANGSDSFVADANPDLLRLADRDLAIDGVREVIVRRGRQMADLRRRSLLKRLLFLFAGAPGRVFSKEDIVQTVWEVEYHPLRHDAALFTNIMRIRRLLGDDGADLIRVTEDGYRFEPPKDFVFVENAS